MASVIWLTVGKTHDAMVEFMLKGFKDQSAINGAYIKFMVHNNNSEKGSTYRTELACVEQKMGNIKTEHSNKIKELTGKVEATSKTALNVSNKFKLLEETVRKLSSLVGNRKKKD